MRARCTGAIAFFAAALAACSDPQPQQVDYTPTETPEQFQARRDAEVARAVAEARARRLAEEEEQRAVEAEAMAAARAERIRIMQEHLLRSLKDPDSAQLTGVVLGTTGESLCGWVNAKNSFGGFTGKKRFVVAGDVVFVESDESPAMLEAIWQADCPSS